MRRCPSRSVAVLLSMAALVVAGCGEDEGSGDSKTSAPAGGGEAREFVGTVAGVDKAPGTPAAKGKYFVAVTFDKAGKVTAYVCDGTGSGAQLFEGKANGDKLDLKSKTGDGQLTGTVSDASVKGQVTIAGKSVDYTTDLAKGVGGLYLLTRTSGDPNPDANSVRGNVAKQVGEGGKAGILFIPVEGERKTIKDDRPPRDDSQVRAVVLDNGARKGQKTLKSKQLKGTNFTDPGLFG